MKTAVIIYYSATGNTEKVGQAIGYGLEQSGFQVTLKKSQFAENLDWFNYDLVCLGSPSIQWHPAKPMDNFLKTKFEFYKKQNKVKPSVSVLPGKHALIFVTFSGPHTGINEAIPAGKYMAQFAEHLGFSVLAEWYILSEFHGNLENNTLGKMGDIRGKPTAADLLKIKEDTKVIVERIK